jgi:hypothetical protein
MHPRLERARPPLTLVLILIARITTHDDSTMHDRTPKDKKVDDHLLTRMRWTYERRVCVAYYRCRVGGMGVLVLRDAAAAVSHAFASLLLLRCLLCGRSIASFGGVIEREFTYTTSQGRRSARNLNESLEYGGKRGECTRVLSGGTIQVSIFIARCGAVPWRTPVCDLIAYKTVPIQYKINLYSQGRSLRRTPR